MISFLIAAALAAQARPDLSNGVACVIDQTAQEDAASIGAEVLAGRDIANSGAFDRLTAAIRTCNERLGWNDALGLRVSTVSVSEMSRSGALERLAAAGIDADALDRWFDSQSEDFRLRAFFDMADDEAAGALETLVPDTLAMDVFERNSELVGGYLASRVILLRAERGLPFE